MQAASGASTAFHSVLICLQSSTVSVSVAEGFGGAVPAPKVALSTINMGNARSRGKVLLFDVTSPSASPRIAAFGAEPAQSTGSQYFATGRFHAADRNMSLDGGNFLPIILDTLTTGTMSQDGGEHIRNGLLSCNGSMSRDGGEYLRHGFFSGCGGVSEDGGQFLRYGLFPERSPFMSTDGGDFLRYGLFPEQPTEMSLDGGEYLRYGLFPERDPFQSTDGGNFLRHGLFPEQPKEMSLDGGEYLRYGLFPEEAQEMSVDGGEYLRHAIFPDAPAPAVQVRPPVIRTASCCQPQYVVIALDFAGLKRCEGVRWLELVAWSLCVCSA